MEHATCDRIISRVAAIVSSTGPALGDFDIVYGTGDVNVSPVMLVEGNLGIASWCVKHVYCYAYNNVLQHAQKIWRYEDCEAVCQWTQFCLLVRPEVTTFWNLRRKLMKKGLISSETELLLTRLILSRKPKCIEAFFQRQWLINKEQAVMWPNDSGTTRQRIVEEQRICTWASERHQNNYHAWNHRLWLLKKHSSLSNELCLELLNLEFSTVKKWIGSHVSEHSGLHYANKLFEFIIHCSQEGKFPLESAAPFVQKPRDVYAEMLKWNESLIKNFQGHESLFYARRSLMMKWRQCCTEQQHNKINQNNCNPNSSTQSAVTRSVSNSPNQLGIAVSLAEVDHSSNVRTGTVLLTNTVDESNESVSCHHRSKEHPAYITENISDSSGSPICVTSDVADITDDDLPAIKRTCIENITSEWSRLVLAEIDFSEACMKSADTDYCRQLVSQHKQAVCRMGL